MILDVVLYHIEVNSVDNFVKKGDVMLFLFIGCVGFTENTVWLIELSSNVTGDCSNNLEHNFIVEESSGGGGDYYSDWTYSSEYSSSNSLSLFQTSNKLKTGLLLIDDQLIPGKKEGGVWTYSWKNRDFQEEEERHVSSYLHIYEEEEISKYTVTFDTKEKTGTYRIKTTSAIAEYETDKWDPNEVDKYYGDINTYVVGIYGNSYDEEECISSGNICQYTMVQECDISIDFSAQKTALESIEGFENYENPGGFISIDFDTGW